MHTYKASTYPAQATEIPDQHAASMAVAGSGYSGQKQITACVCEFDAWKENPYTKVLQKSIDEDYVPKYPAAVARHKSTVRKWNWSGVLAHFEFGIIIETMEHSQYSSAGSPLVVLFDDYEKLERELAAANKRCQQLEDWFKAAQNEVERLSVELNYVRKDANILIQAGRDELAAANKRADKAEAMLAARTK